MSSFSLHIEIWFKDLRHGQPHCHVAQYQNFRPREWVLALDSGEDYVFGACLY